MESTEREHDHALIVFVLIVAIVLSVGTAIVIKQVSANTDKIARLERLDVMHLQHDDEIARLAIKRQDQAIVLIRKTNYRLCLRGQITRAAINIDVTRDEPLLPLYNCRPNLIGESAKRLTPKQTKSFESYVSTTPNLP